MEKLDEQLQLTVNGLP